MPHRAVTTGKSAPVFRKRLIWLLICAATVYIVGNGCVPLWDRDEPRYAQTSRQMLQSGDWVMPHFLDEPRLKKPVFIYWCQAAAMKLIGDREARGAFAARLPSVVAMLATVAMLALVLRREMGRRRVVWAAFIFASSGLSVAAAKMCLTDSVLLLWVTMAQLALYRIWCGRGTWLTWIALGVGVGFALLTKLPVVLGVMGATLIVLIILRWIDPPEASPRIAIGMRPLIALLIAGAILLPWVIPLMGRVPSGELWATIWREVFQRARTAQEGHKGPPGYYLLLIWVTYFPWSLLLPGAIVYGWKHRHDRLTRFALASVIGPWVMFEMVQTKLPHYLLPIFPWLAVLTARMLLRAGRPGREELRNKPFVAVASIWCGIVGLLAIIPMLASLFMPTRSLIVMFAVAIAAVGFEWARWVFLGFRRRRPMLAALGMGAGMFVMIALLYGGFLPRVPDIQTSLQVADVLRQEGATRRGEVIMIDYKEPSLAFYQGGTIREESNDNYLLQTDPLLWPRWIVLTRRIWDALPPSVRDRVQPVATVNGWWYAKGRRVEVLVVRKR